MTMWRELVEAVCPECTFNPPASEAVLAEVRAALGVDVPDDLRALWLETNGVQNKWGEGIWSAERVIRDNLEFRSYPEQDDLYMTFESCFFFAHLSNGDQFFFPVQADGRINWRRVFVWNHEDDSRVALAFTLQRFLEQWFGGQLHYSWTG